MPNDKTQELIIESLGSRGDGIVQGPEGPVYVPFTLPGERVCTTVKGERGELLEVLEESSERCAPICRHFGTCGGCSLQHLQSEPYLEWKREQVRQAFTARGFEIEIEPVIPAQASTRRRSVLAARRTRSSVLLGYLRRSSHEIVDAEECPILRERIVGVLPRLREMLGPLLSRKGQARLTILDTANGLDIAIEGVREIAGPDLLMQMSQWTDELDLARLTVNGEILATRRPPALMFGGVEVVPEPAAFVQATQEAEDVLVRHILDACKGALRVADLFSGSGTFTLPLARQSEVLAVEVEQGALDAIGTAVRNAQGLKPVKTLSRDLFREPMSPDELAEFDAVIFDPPRAGASAQAMQLAQSTVNKIVAVSCNPATLARDVRILVDGGYQVLKVQPVDQFLYSAHVEVVAVMVR